MNYHKLNFDQIQNKEYEIKEFLENFYEMIIN